MAQVRKKKRVSSAIVPVQHAPEAEGARPPRRARWAGELAPIFEDFERSFRWPRLWGPARWLTEPAIRMPAVDVYEKDNEVVVKAEIPGMSKEDIQVNLANSTLTISGEKKTEEEIKDQDYYRCERSFGSFTRSIELPAPVKTEGTTATFKDGLLEIHLPRAEAAKRKLIKVEER